MATASPSPFPERLAVAAVFGPVEAPTTFEETVERLGAAPRDHHADPERPFRAPPGPRRRQVRRRRAAAGRGAGGDRARRALARPARLPDRDRGRRSAARRRTRPAGRAGAHAG